jgi:hypothetical protein
VTPRRSFRAFAAATPVWAAALALAAGQDNPPAKPADEKAELAEFLDDARHYAIRIVGKTDAVLKLHEPPVLNFTNPERNQERGSVFVWLHDDRPAVMGQLFRHDGKTKRIKKHALHSLAAEPLTATYHDKPAWAPDGPGVEWKAFPAAPPVAAGRPERLLQMRALARPFKLTLTDPRSMAVTALRLIPRPLFEYAAPKAGVTDGAIFSFVVATDPEAILLVEAFDEAGKTGFRYAFARFHFWKLAAALGDKPVWEVAFDPTMINNPLGKPETMKKVYNSFVP